jgi:hypothetical protein
MYFVALVVEPCRDTTINELRRLLSVATMNHDI